MPCRLASFAVSVALLAGACAAVAAGVSVLVTDAAGEPLTDAVVTLEPVGAKAAVKPMAGVQIAQHHLQFDPPLTVVTVGTPVAFPNQDTVRHHVYSFSPAKTFQLKLYSGVPHDPVVFDKPGVAVLGCNIHDQMVAWVVVVDTPYVGRTTAGGRARIDGVPAGSYELHAWHASLAEGTPPAALALAVGAADVEQRIRLGATGPAK